MALYVATDPPPNFEVTPQPSRMPAGENTMSQPGQRDDDRFRLESNDCFSIGTKPKGDDNADTKGVL
jgi:hypothetical protein